MKIASFNTKQKLTWHAWLILCKKLLSVSPGSWTNDCIGLSSLVIPGNIISFPTKSFVLISPSFCFLFFLLLLFFTCIVPFLSAWFIFINRSTLLGSSWKSIICGGALILFCKLHKTQWKHTLFWELSVCSPQHIDDKL